MRWGKQSPSFTYQTCKAVQVTRRQQGAAATVYDCYSNMLDEGEGQVTPRSGHQPRRPSADVESIVKEYETDPLIVSSRILPDAGRRIGRITCLTFSYRAATDQTYIISRGKNMKTRNWDCVYHMVTFYTSKFHTKTCTQNILVISLLPVA